MRLLLLLLRALLAVCLVAAAILATRYSIYSSRIRPITYTTPTGDTPPLDLTYSAAALFNPRNLRVVDASSVTLVLFCHSTYSSIHVISNLVTDHQVMVVCPTSAASAAIAFVRSALPHTNVTTRTSNKPGEFFSLLQAACGASTPWVVLLDHNFDRFATFFTTLLHPYDIPVALGAYGDFLQESSHYGFLRPALFAEPPLAIKRDILCQALQGLPNGIGLSLALGIRLLGLSALGYGALLLPNAEHIEPTPGKWTRQVHNVVRRIARGEIESITYLVILPDLVSLLAFQRTICRMALYGHTIHLLLHSLKHPPSRSTWLLTGTCRLRYSTSDSLTLVLQWSQPLSPDVIITLSFPDQTSFLLPVLLKHAHPMAQILSLSPSDLPNSEWFAALTLQEWKRRPRFTRCFWLYSHLLHVTDWRVPLIRLVVITNNRPASLTRLLRSLTAASYFGDDNVHLTINMEQTADSTTRAFVGKLHSQWLFGPLSVRHRVVLGGLIPAIVESWYPASRDEYAIVLEDDVEVSPMFYAWAKMAVLRYRYGRGKRSELAVRVFGISLYQPRNVELRPEGRQTWDPQEVFRQANVSDPTQVYLNQVPCSWGAVYFPEIWREFHDFLVLRLSAPLYPTLFTATATSNHPKDPTPWNSNSRGGARQRLSLNEFIVPDVRSNRWTRSWKRFFIELVFLRGYLMVYPNYDGFLSFSTNHLERGSHVSDTSAQKKAMFVVPLMGTRGVEGDTFVDGLPWGELPALEDMTVVDLMGYIVNPGELARIGEERRSALTDRRKVPGSFDARELFYP